MVLLHADHNICIIAFLLFFFVMDEGETSPNTRPKEIPINDQHGG